MLHFPLVEDGAFRFVLRRSLPLSVILSAAKERQRLATPQGILRFAFGSLRMTFVGAGDHPLFLPPTPVILSDRRESKDPLTIATL